MVKTKLLSLKKKFLFLRDFRRTPNNNRTTTKIGLDNKLHTIREESFCSHPQHP